MTVREFLIGLRADAIAQLHSAETVAKLLCPSIREAVMRGAHGGFA
jgi:hypothetical protein